MSLSLSPTTRLRAPPRRGVLDDFQRILIRTLFWLIVIAVSVASPAVSAALCDADSDNDVDRNDINLILAAVGSPATGPDDPRDFNGDGTIKRNDAKKCARRCTQARCEVPNAAPVANAGQDINAETGVPVTLDGSASSDPDGDPLTYAWRFLGVPPGSAVTDASLANPNTATPSFTPDVNGQYTLELRVSDGALSSTDSVTVTATTPNVPPNANAGQDQTVQLGPSVSIQGSGSDPDNGPGALSFQWSFASVPPGSALTDADISATTTSPTTTVASFTPDVAGEYRVKLTVSDAAATDEDEVVITVVEGCPTGFEDCDGNPANGCETNTTNDPNNCGTCGFACDFDCVNGQCTTSCSAGSADCDLNPFNGCEVNTTNDPNNCGTCGSTCEFDCVNGQCT